MDDTVKCFICNHEMEYFFSKKFNEIDVGTVDYVKCGHCGFVISKTHMFMSKERWVNLNRDYHELFQDSECCPDDPRWIDRLNNQASAIKRLHAWGIINNDLPYVDYGCGAGKLSDLLSKEEITVKKFDKYLGKSKKDYVSYPELEKTKYSLVITTSVFEHIMQINDLEEIISLLDDNGCFALHTLVKETIAKDPSWFYLLPVHTSFYTNKSMKILFKKWGFAFSVYHVKSRMWFWFKNAGAYEKVKKIIQKENKKLTSGDTFSIKKGFYDYWKI